MAPTAVLREYLDDSVSKAFYKSRNRFRNLLEIRNLFGIPVGLFY